MEDSQLVRLISLVLVLLLALPMMFVVFRQSNALRNFVIWLALFAALAWGYHIVVEKPSLNSGAPVSSFSPDDTNAASPDAPPTEAPLPEGPAVRNL